MNEFEVVKGKVAIVTGGSQGLGRVFAMDLAKCGMRVAVIARNRKNLDDTVAQIEAAGGEAIAVAAEVTDKDAIERSVQLIETEFGPVDLLVNAAGAVLPVGQTWNLDVDEWWRVMETNVKGPLICCGAVLRRMVGRGRGRIINVASSTVLHGKPHMSAYVTSKTALVKFTEILAAELAGSGIVAFSIHPGTVETAMTQALRLPENARWVPWFKTIFDEGRNNPASIGSRLVQYLSSGMADALSGRYFLVPMNPQDTVDQSKAVLDEDHNLLRMQFLSGRIDSSVDSGI
jgi:NAD(P)-dependent dehydrogenase (short-subunit alcohol dehydrogenase family)